METKQLINKRDPSIQTKIIENPSINELEKEISQNHIIISPLYGK
jgi:glutaredoxin